MYDLIKTLSEQALRDDGGEIETALKRQADSARCEEHVADIDEFRVFRSSNDFLLITDAERAAHFRIKASAGCATLDQMYVYPNFRSKSIVTKFILFLKSRLNFSQIALGNVHSRDTYQILKSGNLKFFKKFWRSGVNGEEKPFSADTVDEFYAKGKWALILENNSNEFDDFPRYRTGDDYLRESYDVLISIFNSNEFY